MSSKLPDTNHVSSFLKSFFLLLIIVTMGISGLVALDEGFTRFTAPFVDEQAAQKIVAKVEQVRAEPTMENMRQVGNEMAGLSAMSSVDRYANSKVIEQVIHYAQMSTINQMLMLVHVVLGSFCMLLGGFQFWPAFRKKYMKVHRIFGAIYIVTVPISVVASLFYLANTAPHYIYAHLVAWIALWIFGALSLMSIFMAIKALRAKRIYEHQGWMALSFGSLMVAPILRWDWALLAAIFPSIDQDTLNLVTMGMMLPQCLLIAYGLVLVNRQYARPMKQRKPHAFAVKSLQIFNQVLPALYALSVVALLAQAFYFINDGLAGLSFSTGLSTTGLIHSEQQALAAVGVAKWLLVLSTGMALPLGLYTLKGLLNAAEVISLQTKRTGVLVAVLTLLGGLLSLGIGCQMGLLPHKQLFSGGTMYIIDGAVLVLFALFYLAANYKQQVALMKESLVFMLCTLPFMAIYFLTLYVMQFMPLPADYLAAGQGYVIPVGFSMALFFLAIFYVIFGQATREHN